MYLAAAAYKSEELILMPCSFVTFHASQPLVLVASLLNPCTPSHFVFLYSLQALSLSQTLFKTNKTFRSKRFDFIQIPGKMYCICQCHLSDSNTQSSHPNLFSLRTALIFLDDSIPIFRYMYITAPQGRKQTSVLTKLNFTFSCLSPLSRLILVIV